VFLFHNHPNAYKYGSHGTFDFIWTLCAVNFIPRISKNRGNYFSKHCTLSGIRWRD